MSDKTIVVITGANIGVGLATARWLALASPKYHIILASRNPEKNAAALADIQATPNIKGTTSTVTLDVDDNKSIIAAAEAVASEFGRIDVLINNAGLASFAKDLETQYHECLTTNAIGAALVTEAFKPLLLKSLQPKLLFITSSLGSIENQQDPTTYAYGPVYVAYRVSKAAMNMIMSCYYTELKEKGAKVWGLCPGYVHSNLRKESEPAPGALSADTSAETIETVLDGKRDADVGKVVHKGGVYPW